MARFKSQREIKQETGVVKSKNKLPPELRRRRNPKNRSEGNALADFMPRAQCVGLARSKLKRYWIGRMIEDKHQGIPAVDDPQFRYSDITELARALGYDTDSKKLPDSVRATVRCAQPAIAGGMVCRFHGGSLKAVQSKAKENFYGMLFPAQKRMLQIISKGKHEPAVVAAAKEIFEITGMKKMEESASQGYSEALISKMAEVFDEAELEMFIKLSRKLESVRPDDDSEEGGAGGGKMKTIQVTPTKMVELLSSGKKKKQ